MISTCYNATLNQLILVKKIIYRLDSKFIQEYKNIKYNMI